MEYRTYGKILKGVGGLYKVKLCGEEEHREKYPDTLSPLAGKTVYSHAGGVLRHNNTVPLPGDNAEIIYTDRSKAADSASAEGGEKNCDIRISEIVDRRNALIRPPLANLDVLFVTMAAASPSPVLTTVDKLTAIAEHNDIEPVIIVGKRDLSPDFAEEIKSVYEKCGFCVFTLSAKDGDGTDGVSEYIKESLKGKTAAFAGASGVGKSTLINRLFPTLALKTNTVSEKILRGKHTTRHVELFPLSDDDGCGYIADTPGFSLIDFEHFDFFDKEDLAYNMREFRPYIGKCRYTKCSHTKEEGCAVTEAVREGKIPASRHNSFVEIYTSLKSKNKWQK